MLKNISMPVIALALGHLVTDLQAGALPIVLPHLKELFALSYSQLAFIVLTQNVTSSVIQPLFGYITDKKSLPAMLPFCAACCYGRSGLCVCRLGSCLCFTYVYCCYNRYGQCNLSSAGFKNS